MLVWCVGVCAFVQYTYLSQQGCFSHNQLGVGGIQIYFKMHLFLKVIFLVMHQMCIYMFVFSVQWL